MISLKADMTNAIMLIHTENAVHFLCALFCCEERKKQTEIFQCNKQYETPPAQLVLAKKNKKKTTCTRFSRLLIVPVELFHILSPSKCEIVQHFELVSVIFCLFYRCEMDHGQLRVFSHPFKPFKNRREWHTEL